MTVDTSRPAVEALIADLRNPAWNVDQSRTASALQALLDERDAARDASVWRDTIDEQRAYIRDLEATVDNLRLISNANGDWNIKYQEVNHRAERAEEQLQAIREVVTGWNGFTGLTREVLAILDTSGCWWEFEDGDRKFLPHERADNGACANCFAILADTDEGGSNV